MRETILDWDSAFFGFRVASLELDVASDEKWLSARLANVTTDLLYVSHSPITFKQFQGVLEQRSAKYWGNRVVWRKAIDVAALERVGDVEEAAAATSDLVDLAYASGHYSRFFLDPKFRLFYHKLYRHWILTSFGIPLGKVFTIAGDSGLEGFASASVEDGMGKVGLLAVAEARRGQGLGRRLLQRCEQYYAELGLTECRVITQKSNLAACRLYERAGYRIESEQCIWHLWNR